MEGTAALNADLSARGETPAAMLAALNGRGTLEVRNLSLAAMSALPKNVPGLIGKEGKVPSRFDLVRAPFTVRNGEIVAQPITVTATGFIARGQARASLPRQYLDAAAEITTLGMTIPVVAKGPSATLPTALTPNSLWIWPENCPAFCGTPARGPGARAGRCKKACAARAV